MPVPLRERRRSPFLAQAGQLLAQVAPPQECADRAAPRRRLVVAIPAMEHFSGVRDAWLGFDVDVPDRDSRELLRSFEASARAFGCTTGKGGGWSTGMPGGGRARVYWAILAQCEEGDIAIAALDHGRVRVACPKPATREQCEALLGQISVAR